MRSWRESGILAAMLFGAALACAYRGGALIERERHDDPPPAAVVDPCDGENLTYREDDVSVRTYVGDPGNGHLCAVVPKSLVVFE